MKKIEIYDEVTEHLIREIFFALRDELGFKVLSSRANFPDFVLIRNNKVIRAEVEVLASNFYLHNHSEKDCDLIICYINDLERETPLKILELKEFIKVNRNSKETKIVSNVRGINLEEKAELRASLEQRFHDIIEEVQNYYGLKSVSETLRLIIKRYCERKFPKK